MHVATLTALLALSAAATLRPRPARTHSLTASPTTLAHQHKKSRPQAAHGSTRALSTTTAVASVALRPWLTTRPACLQPTSPHPPDPSLAALELAAPCQGAASKYSITARHDCRPRPTATHAAAHRTGSARPASRPSLVLGRVTVPASAFGEPARTIAQAYRPSEHYNELDPASALGEPARAIAQAGPP